MRSSPYSVAVGVSFKQANVQAGAALGIMYGKGESVPQDYVKAAQWHRKVAKQGLADARVALKQLTLPFV